MQRANRLMNPGGWRLISFERGKKDIVRIGNSERTNGIKLAHSFQKINWIDKSIGNTAGSIMAGIDKRTESHPSLSEHQQFEDQGGSRSGRDRREGPEPFEGNDRRSGRDRRHGIDRRGGIERRRSNGRRSERYFRDGELVERRDIFRRHIKDN